MSSGRAGLIVERRAKIRNRRLQLVAIHMDHGAQPQAIDVAAIGAENAGDQGVGGINIFPGKIYFCQFDLGSHGVVRSTAVGGQCFQQFEAVGVIALGEIEIRQRHLVREIYRRRQRCGIMSSARAAAAPLSQKESNDVKLGSGFFGSAAAIGASSFSASSGRCCVDIEFGELLMEGNFLRVKFDQVFAVRLRLAGNYRAFRML